VEPLLIARLKRAAKWGLAIRLAQRLSGGATHVFTVSALERAEGELRLLLDAQGAAYRGEQVEKRLKQLAESLDLAPRTIVQK
jgi:exopolyphosphatase/guanosine-5'-triphosphate,3'-diphosphate pyrophosphatase